MLSVVEVSACPSMAETAVIGDAVRDQERGGGVAHVVEAELLRQLCGNEVALELARQVARFEAVPVVEVKRPRPVSCQRLAGLYRSNAWRSLCAIRAATNGGE